MRLRFWGDIIIKISFDKDPRCERIIHIIQRRELEGHETSIADIQEVIIGKRGNSGKHGSIYTAIRYLKNLGFISITKNTKDRRKKVISLNWNKLKVLTISDDSIIFWEKLDTFYDNIGITDSFFESVKLVNQLKRGEFECKICFNKYNFEFDNLEEVVGEGVLHSTQIVFKCENCGFKYTKVIYN